MQSLMMFWIILASTVVLFIIFVARNDPPPISGVYRQPGKWYNIKYWIFYVILKLRKHRSKNRLQAAKGEDAGYGMKSRSSEKEMDCVQLLPLEHPSVWLASRSLSSLFRCYSGFNIRQDKTTRGHGRRHYSASKSASPMSILTWQYLLYSTKNSDRSPVPVRLALQSNLTGWLDQNLSKRFLNTSTESTFTT